MNRMKGMKILRLAEGGRAALSFPLEIKDGSPDWEATRENAMLGASRANILKEWSSLPQDVRKDAGFQCMMDHYNPLTEEGYAVKQRMQSVQIKDRLKTLLGSRASSKDVNESNLDALIAGLDKEYRACVDFGVPFGGTSVILTNSTSHTVVGTKARANQAVRLWGFDVGFDGTTSTNGPGICEIQQNTFATNPPGTNSVTVTGAVIDFGRPETVQATAAKAWTTEPTAITTVEVFFIPNYMGSGIVFTPLTKPFVLAGATGPTGASMRVTQQSGITGNATGALKHEE